jgi:DNA invertase Pin-like site-specific DNA recombinase
MTSEPASSKVTDDHLKRDAYLYIRQSTVRQVMENTESTQRQYALRQRAVALGWPLDRIMVIDNDQGQSGALPGERAGFQRLVAVRWAWGNGTLGYRKLSQDQWDTLIHDAHPGYISWQEYEENERRLQENATAFGSQRHRSPPREGPALLQGLALCGRCGTPMAVRYHQRYDRLVPDYVCQRGCVRRGEPVCQVVPGAGVDEAIGVLLLASVSPMALEVSLRIQNELQARMDEADRLRHQQVERAKYEAELARRRFMQVDPDNRLVADTLEGEWNEKLRLLAETQKECERLREQDHAALDEQQRAQILALATDFPRLWRDPQTPDRERKRMVRLVLEDVTLVKGDEITIHVRFKGGVCQTLTRPIPPNAWQKRKTSPEVVAEIDCLLDKHTEAQIAVLLNERGYRSGADRSFTPLIVGEIRRAYNLKSRYDRLRAPGLLTQKEIASILGVSVSTVKDWRQNGLLHAHPFNDKNEALYEHPGDDPPTKHQGRKLTDKRLDLLVWHGDHVGPTGVLQPRCEEVDLLAGAIGVDDLHAAQVMLTELARYALEPHLGRLGLRRANRLDQLMHSRLAAGVAQPTQPAEDLDGGQRRLLLQDGLHLILIALDGARPADTPGRGGRG